MKVNKLIQSIMASALIGLFSTSVMAGDYPVYEGFNTEAKAMQAYSGQPGKGKTIAFANIVNGSPFCDLVEASVVRQALLAGFDKDNIIILNEVNSDGTIKYKFKSGTTKEQTSKSILREIASMEGIDVENLIIVAPIRNSLNGDGAVVGVISAKA